MNICVMFFILCVFLYIVLSLKENFADGDEMDISTLTSPIKLTEGEIGDKGDTGAKGIRGVKGVKGDTGPKGNRGVIDLSKITFIDRKQPTSSSPAAPSKMIVPSNLCIGDACITSNDFDNMMKSAGCDLYLWDPPPNYRDFSTVLDINPMVNPSDIVDPKISWKTLNPTARMADWGCGMIDGSCLAWHPAWQIAGTGTEIPMKDRNKEWQIIYTEPKISQKVKGVRVLPRKDFDNYGNDYVYGITIRYKPLDNAVIDPSIPKDLASGELFVMPGPNDPVPPAADNDKTSFYFKDQGAWSGIEVYFNAPIECKYIRIIYTYHTRYAINRTGLYLCL